LDLERAGECAGDLARRRAADDGTNGRRRGCDRVREVEDACCDLCDPRRTATSGQPATLTVLRMERRALLLTRKCGDKGSSRVASGAKAD
jgi:hypothetical protein